MPLFSATLDSRKYRKWFPSGKKTGVEAPKSCWDASTAVNGDAAPPAAETRHTPLLRLPKMMTPSGFQDPPVMMVLISQMRCGEPPDTSTLMSLFRPSPAGNAMDRLSGDQVMEGDASVSATRRRDSTESSERIHRPPRPSAPMA